MTEDEMIVLGRKAEAVLNDNNYNDLFEFVTNELARQILATSIEDTAERDAIFQTYNGMRAFAGQLAAMVLTKDQILETREADKNPQSGDDF